MLKTKEELLTIIADAEKAIEALEVKWVPPSGNWLIYGTGDTENIAYKEFEPIIQECGLLRTTEAIALRACKEVREYCRLLAYRDEYAMYNTQNKYCIRQTNAKYGYEIELHEYIRLGTVYFDKPTAIRLITDLNSGKYTL